MLKDSQFKDSLSYLPEEFLLKVLEALSLKSLCRFISVCKSWNELLSSPSFIPSSLSSPRIFCTSSLSFPPKTKRNCREDRLIGISSCSNGILCFLSKTEKKFLIGNPLRQKEFFSIPTPNTDVDEYTMAFSFDPINGNIIIMAFESLDVGLPIYDRTSSHPFCTSHCIIGTTWYALCHHSTVCYDMNKKAWEKIGSPLSLELQLMDLNSWWYSDILEWNGRLSYVITRGSNIDGSLKAGLWVFSWEEKKWVEALQADLKEWGLTGPYHNIGCYDDNFFLMAHNKCITYDMDNNGQLKRFESDQAGWFLPMPFRRSLFTCKPTLTSVLLCFALLSCKVNSYFWVIVNIDSSLSVPYISFFFIPYFSAILNVHSFFSPFHILVFLFLFFLNQCNFFLNQCN
ncbi:hypothetical protein AMTRI_Chr07g28950 [Amborella trichopoda]